MLRPCSLYRTYRNRPVKGHQFSLVPDYKREQIRVGNLRVSGNPLRRKYVRVSDGHRVFPEMVLPRFAESCEVFHYLSGRSIDGRIGRITYYANTTI